MLFFSEIYAETVGSQIEKQNAKSCILLHSDYSQEKCMVMEKEVGKWCERILCPLVLLPLCTVVLPKEYCR